MYDFINNDFLLNSANSQNLYHEVAKSLPIIDYHNHIDVDDLLKNKSYKNITQLWLSKDPYKHRAMRINGVPEKYITGDAPDDQKFYQWAETVPKLLGNPLYHWTHMELKSIFGINKLLSEKTAEDVWFKTTDALSNGNFAAVDIIKKFNIEFLCTSDDLIDDLSRHAEIRAKYHIEIYPSLRSDTIINFDDNNWIAWKNKLSDQTSVTIDQLEDYQAAILNRLDYYASSGCKLSDHALDPSFLFTLPKEAEANTIFSKVLKGDQILNDELVKLKSYMLRFLGEEYGKRGWAMQLHIGAQRSTSSRLKKIAGKHGGYASIGSSFDVASICGFLDALEQSDLLPKTILYTLNPADNPVLASLTGSFSEDGVKGKVQFGPAWWYNDHLIGLQDQLTTLANFGLLSHFIGMTTDSRSLLSFSRHDYFRRVLCRTLGSWVEDGLVPNDEYILKELIQSICYTNIKNWLSKNEVYEVVNKK